MTVNSLLKVMDLLDHSSNARFPDGSGGEDKYTIIVQMNGHGKLLNAKVENVHVGTGMMFVNVKGV